ncbi:MAG: aminotransferase class IV [Clostridiales bacterium]|nr:aminotransferase class IV [Clostridiales bacterium]
MAYPMLESPIGQFYLYDGLFIPEYSNKANELRLPTDAVTYYETLRVKRGVPLFIEDHLARLEKSVNGIEQFEVDKELILDQSMYFLNKFDPDFDGSLRIVLTRKHLLIHACEANIPGKELFEEGINTLSLKWERVAPNIKVFRGDYKEAVAQKFKEQNAHGNPYEIVLTDNDGRLYEGSKSNLFVIKDGEVYSAPDEKILLGITRNRVMKALEASGATLKIGMFTLEQIVADKQAAMFVSSTPFDILPIRYIDGYEFDFKSNELLKNIQKSYQEFADEYISKFQGGN